MNVGPSHQSVDVSKALGVMPLEIRSAGLCSERTWRQSDVCVRRCIAAILFATNTLSWSDALLSQWRTISESVHRKIAASFNDARCRSLDASALAISAAHNSIRGMVVASLGANLLFAMSRHAFVGTPSVMMTE